MPAQAGTGQIKLLAFRAYSKEFQFMVYGGVTIAAGDFLFQFRRETFLNFNYGCATSADEVVMVRAWVGISQFETGCGISKMITFHQASALEKLH